MEVITEVNHLIDSRIASGSAMRKEEKPRNRTLYKALDMLTKRQLLIETRDQYCINAEKTDLVDYYANSIR
jgi:hypothetical protein